MPFPPDLTNAWDNTFPPDTQLANLLGQDLRNFRVDVQQRLSLLSGTLANRPSNMDAVFGGAGYGILFFATDTSQIFQWNGAAWVDVTTGIVIGGRLSNVVPVVTNGAGQDGVIVTIPAAALVSGMEIRIAARVSLSGNNSVALFFGATQLRQTNGANATAMIYEATLLVTGAATQQGEAMSTVQENPNPTGAPLVGLVSPTEAIANNIIVKTRQTAGAVGTVTHDYISVRWR